MTNTTGATWIAGRACNALISLSAPSAEAIPVAAAHPAAIPIWPFSSASAASFVHTPLMPNANPPESIVRAGAGWWKKLST